MLPEPQPLCYFFHDQQVMLQRRSDPNAALDLPGLPPYIDPIILHHLLVYQRFQADIFISPQHF